MAEYLGVVELGALYKNGIAQNRPSKPWRISSEPVSGIGVGDISDFESLIDMSKWTLGDTPSDSAKKLKWVKIKDGDKTLLICDRVILVNVSWNDLNSENYITGKTITIDGQQCKVRLLTGGSNKRNDNYYAGGTPIDNEWDRFITREESISGLPSPTSSDLDTTRDMTDKNSTHNQFWNWMGVYTWCQEVYSSNTSYRAIRGGSSARWWFYGTASGRTGDLGWRPVLEILNSAPLLSGSDTNFGDKNSDFQITYQVNDTDSEDVLTIREKLDGVEQKVISPAQRNFQYTIDVDIDSLSLGTHTVSIEVSDGKGASATRTYTFKRTNAAPTISGQDQNLGDKNIGFQVVYQVTDSDNDSITVKEKLNGDIIRILSNAPKGQDITIDIDNDTLYALPLLSSNTVTIEADDGNGGVSYRTYTFRRTNTAPLISGTDEELGEIAAPMTRDYIVTDAEGDTVVITEKIDDIVIKSFVATLGASNTVTIPKEEWLKLTNGSHTLKVEATDSNGSTSIRNFNFMKSETKIKLALKEPFETDAKASKILVTPSWNIEGATATVEACNNGFDEIPTWEDITSQVAQNRHFNFTNEVKTAEKWGVNIKITIDKNPDNENEVSIRGFGGAFE
ncbi:Ig-like domain-containing protein [Maledivibacter halophilus]|uniref:Uncharacterized protein n=1 Tax=Maledivibacter halophilus TaxID=36842 RepID=A0A1T5KX70_9FIRM|nr:hypothetical protein [Maledivibacter halophilus]SKC67989.1 hypothetical protein SAMN02194393_02119 [Maledivibacter halophilus]SKC71908.1 hypothetical protein SAMN02194393_02533 [Maledivibacter halophilus]SKC80092.1 hypothetical protein SAMN02194393_03430 [Maledivibacter halophilus]